MQPKESCGPRRTERGQAFVVVHHKRDHRQSRRPFRNQRPGLYRIATRSRSSPRWRSSFESANATAGTLARTGRHVTKAERQHRWSVAVVAREERGHEKRELGHHLGCVACLSVFVTTSDAPKPREATSRIACSRSTCQTQSRLPCRPERVMVLSGLPCLTRESHGPLVTPLRCSIIISINYKVWLSLYSYSTTRCLCNARPWMSGCAWHDDVRASARRLYGKCLF